MKRILFFLIFLISLTLFNSPVFADGDPPPNPPAPLITPVLPNPPAPPAPPDPNALYQRGRKETLIELGLESDDDVKSFKELMKELKSKKKKKPDEPDGDEVTKRNRFLEDENLTVKRQAEAMKIENAVILEITQLPQKFFNAEARDMFKKLVTEKLGFDKDGNICVLGENGTPHLNAKGQRTTITELMAEVIKTNGYLLDNGVKKGVGEVPSGKPPIGDGTGKPVSVLGGLKNKMAALQNNQEK